MARAGALLVIGLWLGLLAASWAMASASFRTVRPPARTGGPARAAGAPGAPLSERPADDPAARRRGVEPVDVSHLDAGRNAPRRAPRRGQLAARHGPACARPGGGGRGPDAGVRARPRHP